MSSGVALKKEINKIVKAIFGLKRFEIFGKAKKEMKKKNGRDVQWESRGLSCVEREREEQICREKERKEHICVGGEQDGGGSLS